MEGTINYLLFNRKYCRISFNLRLIVPATHNSSRYSGFKCGKWELRTALRSEIASSKWYINFIRVQLCFQKENYSQKQETLSSLIKSLKGKLAWFEKWSKFIARKVLIPTINGEGHNVLAVDAHVLNYHIINYWELSSFGHSFFKSLQFGGNSHLFAMVGLWTLVENYATSGIP